MKLLRKLREHRGYSLSLLARETQLSPSFLRDIEKGTRNPSVDSLFRLTEVLGFESELFLAARKLEPEMEKTLFKKDFYFFLKQFSSLDSKTKEELLSEFTQMTNATSTEQSCV